MASGEAFEYLIARYLVNKHGLKYHNDYTRLKYNTWSMRYGLIPFISGIDKIDSKIITNSSIRLTNPCEGKDGITSDIELYRSCELYLPISIKKNNNIIKTPGPLRLGISYGNLQERIKEFLDKYNTIENTKKLFFHCIGKQYQTQLILIGTNNTIKLYKFKKIDTNNTYFSLNQTNESNVEMAIFGTKLYFSFQEKKCQVTPCMDTLMAQI